MQKEMFKIISPIEKRGGGTYWMRCGTGFRNKDDSINLYIHALPVAATGQNKELQLQLRQMTEEDFQRNAPGSGHGNGATRAAFQLPQSATTNPAGDGDHLPF